MNNKYDLAFILETVYSKLSKEITNAYINNEINEVLLKYGFEVDSSKYNDYFINTSKILVIGDSRINNNDLLITAKKMGIDKDRIELVTEYKKLQHYNFRKLEYNMNYSDILVGPMPHKVKDYENFIATVEKNQEKYPKMIKITSSNELKISKSTLKEALLKTRLYLELN